MSATIPAPAPRESSRLTALGHRGDLTLPDRPTFGGLFRGEWRRLTSRRATRVLAALLLAGVMATMVGAFVTHSRDDAGARVAAQQAWEDNRASYQNMLDHMSAEERAQQPPVDEAVGPVSNFLQDPRYHFPRELPNVALGVVAACLLLALTLGATSIGAEWHAKTMAGLLVWEPRRLRVFAAKALAVVAATVALALLALALAIGLAALVAAVRGDFSNPLPPGVETQGPSAPELTPVADALWLSLRGVVLTGGLGLAGCAAALLLRSTAAVLGVAFAYVALVESAVRGFGWSVQQHLLSNEVAAWLTPGGFEVYLPEPQLDGSVMSTAVHITHLHAGLVLLGVIAVVAAVAAWTFRRRDIS